MSPYEMYSIRRPGAQDLCTPEFRRVKYAVNILIGIHTYIHSVSAMVPLRDTAIVLKFESVSDKPMVIGLYFLLLVISLYLLLVISLHLLLLVISLYLLFLLVIDLY